jgi:hypothetical protein
MHRGCNCIRHVSRVYVHVISGAKLRSAGAPTRFCTRLVFFEITHAFVIVTQHLSHAFFATSRVCLLNLRIMAEEQLRMSMPVGY